MRALEGGRIVLNWVCVRGVRPNVWCVLTGTIPVARRIRVGHAEGRCLAAWRKRRDFSSVKPDTVCYLRAPIVHGSHGQNLIWFGLNPWSRIGILVKPR